MDRFLLGRCAAILFLAFGAQAALADYVGGMNALAVRDFAKARAEFEADPENGESIFQLAIIASQGLGEPANANRATALYERAAQKGIAAAKVELAFALANGVGTEKDPARAVAMLEELAAKNDPEGMVALGRALLYGWWGITADEPRGAQLFKRAAEAGNGMGKTSYGVVLLEGKGVAKDEAAGLALLREAADQGITLAQTELARILLRGDAVTRDPAAAFALYMKAAERANPTAQYGVALCYWNGWGVARDAETAVRFADAAAQQGNGYAQVFVADAYHTGVGVPRMRTEAYYWLTVAANSQTGAANSARERRAMMAQLLTQAEIDGAVRKAGQFRAVPGFKPRAKPLPALARSDDLKVGEVKISVRSPEGYTNGWEIAEWLQKARPNDPAMRPLLMVLTRREDIDRFKLGIPGLFRCIEVAEYGIADVTVTPELFRDIKKEMRKIIDGTVASGRFKLDEVQRDDDRVYSVVRVGVARPDVVDATAFVLVKQRVLWVSFTGFPPDRLPEVKQLMRASVDELLSTNRGLFGG